MAEQETVINTSTVSPVAATGQAKNWQTKLLFAATGIVVIGGLALHHVWKTGDDPHEENVAQTQNLVAPALVPADPQLAQLAQAVSSAPATTAEAPDHDRPRQDEEAEKLEKMRMVAPTTVYSTTGAQAQQQTATSQNQAMGNGNNGVLGGSGAGDVNTQFMANVSAGSAPVAHATSIAHPGSTLAQGTMIWATLESRIVSDLPGMVRAVTAEDIYSEDGSRVLLPKGSRLIGQYTNAIAQGQQRIFVVWQRVIRPDHIDIQLNSPGTDPLGTAGLNADSIDGHFLEQFGQSALLSIIGAGAANVGVSSQDQFNSSSAYREAIANSFAQTAQDNLRSKGVINPTIYINQGHAISVFVARDLDFYAELQRAWGLS